MKKIFLKSFALIAMLFSVSTLSAASGVDWSTIEFLGDGAGGGKYANKYKVSEAEGLAVVNIQHPGFASEDGIYVHVPAGITACSVKSDIQGAGVLLHLSAFTAQETNVTITYGANLTCTFWVYYVDGTTDGSDTPDTPDNPDTPDTPDTPEDLQEGACSGTAKGVDTYYTENDPEHAVTSLEQGFYWQVQTTTAGVNITVQFLDNLPGMAAPYLFRFDQNGVMMGGDIQMAGWDAATRTATHTLTGLANGEQLVFLVKVALEAGKVLFTERVSYTVGENCETTDIDNVETNTTTKKVIQDGQIYIIHNGIRYNALGVQIK